MDTFVANKFNPETDIDRPVVDSEVEYEKIQYTIKEVSHMTVNEIMRLGKEPDKNGYDEILFKPHSTRPAVIWVLYLNKI